MLDSQGIPQHLGSGAGMFSHTTGTQGGGSNSGTGIPQHPGSGAGVFFHPTGTVRVVSTVVSAVTPPLVCETS